VPVAGEYDAAIPFHVRGETMQFLRLAGGLGRGATGVGLMAAFAAAQETTRVSVSSSGAEGRNGADAPAISDDGNFVAFVSYSTNLVSGDTNGVSDAFVHDRSTGTTERVSVSSSGAQADADTNVGSLPAFSADGNLVAFSSWASTLVPGDTNTHCDIFVHDRSSLVTERVSVNPSGGDANGDSFDQSFSADGQLVAFASYASNLVYRDTNVTYDVFVRDRSSGTTERVSLDSSGNEGDFDSWTPTISADGRLVAFWSSATNLVPGDTNALGDIFVHDRTSGVTERVSVDSSGVQSNGANLFSSISADGRFVVFSSFASNLVAGDTNNKVDVFVHDRTTGSTERVSVSSAGAQGKYDSGSFGCAISADGEIASFDSGADNFVQGDTNGMYDVFIHDRSTGLTQRASVSSSGHQGNDSSQVPAVSSNGLTVAFVSLASNLASSDGNRANDVFVHEFCSQDATWSNYGAGFPGTNGVPSFTSRQNPVLGSSLTLDLANSYANPTAGLLFVGFQQTKLHSGWGGDLLVVPTLTVPLSIPGAGASVTGDIPSDSTLCGVAVDLQVIEVDPGAAKGVSFTAGLELVLGR
jgi:hypothetical protein